MWNGKEMYYSLAMNLDGKKCCVERLMTNVHGSMSNERYRREGNSQMENGGNL